MKIASHGQEKWVIPVERGICSCSVTFHEVEGEAKTLEWVPPTDHWEYQLSEDLDSDSWLSHLFPGCMMVRETTEPLWSWGFPLRRKEKNKQNFLVTQYGCREKSNKITKRKFHIPISRVMALSKPLVITAMIITVTEVTWFSGLYREEERFLCPRPKTPLHPTANQNYMAE